MTALAARLRRPKPVPIPLDKGRPARFRMLQVLLWSVVLGLAGVGVVAGLYFNMLQVNWHIGPVRLFYLKDWWDSGMGLIRSPDWYLYRHGLRDLGEPAVATLAVRTILASRQSWGKRISGLSLSARLIAVPVIAAALILGGVWVIGFGLPRVWTAPAWFIRYSIGNVVLGIITGQVVHRVWAPAGATLQGYFVDRVADRVRARRARVPWWIRYPVSPVQVRERFVDLMMHPDQKITAGKLPKWVMTPAAVLVAYLIVTGLIAKYWVGHGHTLPYLAP